MVDLAKPFHDFVKSADPLVSVIIPSYNKAPFLRETIQSVLTQDYKNLEILVVNDGSPDDTSAVVKKIISENIGRQIKLLEKPNGGISDARNFAIERAAGRVILCLDGDDLAQPTFISKGVKAMREEGVNLVTCDVELFGAETGGWEPAPYERYAIRYNNNIPTLVMYDKVIWARNGGYKKSFAFNEDWEFFINASRGPFHVKKIPEKLFRYRVTTDGLAQQYIKDSWPRSVSLMVTSNDDLYPVEQVLWAHSELSKMPPNWVEKIKKQGEKHPNEWLPKFWLGLAAEASNKPDEAFQIYRSASDLIEGRNWQPIFRMSVLVEKANPSLAANLMHLARVLRPDCERFVVEKIKKITEDLKTQKP